MYLISDSLLAFFLFKIITLCSHQNFRISDGPVLKTYKTQAELEKIKEEMKKIQTQSNELKNEMTFKNLIETSEKIRDMYEFKFVFQ